MRCDRNRPYHRCDRNNVICQYHNEVKDVNFLCIEQLEVDMAALQEESGRIERQKQGVSGSSLIRLRCFTQFSATNQGVTVACSSSKPTIYTATDVSDPIFSLNEFDI